jgi:methyltransferase
MYPRDAHRDPSLLALTTRSAEPAWRLSSDAEATLASAPAHLSVIVHCASCNFALFVAVPLLISTLVTAAVFLMMVVELQLSRSNERGLRAAGALEPADDVYPLMQVAYPASFVLMAIESALHASVASSAVLLGLAIFGCGKVIKFWAIAALGPRWSFRVLVLPGAPLVTSGPYRWMRHPNYVGVMGEIAGVAIALSAMVTGTLALVIFAGILVRRIKVEERALYGPAGGTDGPPAVR